MWLTEPYHSQECHHLSVTTTVHIRLHSYDEVSPGHTQADPPATRFSYCSQPEGRTALPGLGSRQYSVIFTPERGRIVTITWGSTCCPGIKRNRYSYGIWWINRSAISKQPEGGFSSEVSPDRPPHSGVRLHSSASAGTFTHLATT